MPGIDALYSTLNNIIIKVRRLTRTPSTAQLTDADIIAYINTFILYDFPQHIKLFSQRELFTFYTSPYVDTYETNTTNPNNVFYNFHNRYVNIYPPVYIAGYLTQFTQSREQFYGLYPQTFSIQLIGVGDGVTTNFTGTIPNLSSSPQGACIIRNNVLFDSIDVNGNGLSLIDLPVNATTGNLVAPGTTGPSLGTINYLTGAYNVTFSTAPGSGQNINNQVLIQTLSRPLTILYFDNKFIVRPVPDQPYKVTLECLVRPTELLLGSQEPEIAQWWQYIAYGAAKKIFEDRMDVDSVAMILPEFKKQELLVLRSTVEQLSNERVATIYTEQISGSYNGYGFGNGGGNM